jgi:hypothetical protein
VIQAATSAPNREDEFPGSSAEYVVGGEKGAKTMKTLARIALVLAWAVAGARSSAAQPVGTVLHRDFFLLSQIEQDTLFALTLMRTQSGAVVLLDATDGTSLRATPLGFMYPTGSTWGSYTSSPERHAYAAVSRSGEIRVVDLGDLSVPGPLEPVVLDSIAVGAGFDPSSTRMGIIAVLIGLWTEQVPAVFYIQGGHTVVLAFDGTEFRAVGLLDEEGIFYFR